MKLVLRQRLLQNMPSSFPFALRPGEPKSTATRNKGQQRSEWKVAEILSTETSFTSRPAPRTSCQSPEELCSAQS
jgi:hypothetical protein